MADGRTRLEWDGDRYDQELYALLFPRMQRLAAAAARTVDKGSTVKVMDGWLTAVAARVASDWNAATFTLYAEVFRGHSDASLVVKGHNFVGPYPIPDDIPDSLGADGAFHNALEASFGHATGSRSRTLTDTLTTDTVNFAKVDAARQAGVSTKTWRVTSKNPREEHQAMNGETVSVDQPFSNGMMWPGGPNCMCTVDFSGDGLMSDFPEERRMLGGSLRSGRATEAQREAIKNYCGPWSRPLNAWLRHGTLPADYQNVAISDLTRIRDNLDKAMMPTKKSFMVERGSSMHSVEDMVDGALWTDKAFMSTSVGERGGAARLRILVTEGTKGRWVKPLSGYKNEEEFLLARGTKLRVLSIQESPRTAYGGATKQIWAVTVP